MQCIWWMMDGYSIYSPETPFSNYLCRMEKSAQHTLLFSFKLRCQIADLYWNPACNLQPVMSFCGLLLSISMETTQDYNRTSTVDIRNKHKYSFREVFKNVSDFTFCLLFDILSV